MKNNKVLSKLKTNYDSPLKHKIKGFQSRKYKLKEIDNHRDVKLSSVSTLRGSQSFDNNIMKYYLAKETKKNYTSSSKDTSEVLTNRSKRLNNNTTRETSIKDSNHKIEVFFKYELCSPVEFTLIETVYCFLKLDKTYARRKHNI